MDIPAVAANIFEFINVMDTFEPAIMDSTRRRSQSAGDFKTPSPRSSVTRTCSLPAITGIDDSKKRDLDDIAPITASTFAISLAILHIDPSEHVMQELQHQCSAVPNGKRLQGLLQRLSSWPISTAITAERRLAISELLRGKQQGGFDSCLVCTDPLNDYNIAYGDQCKHACLCFGCFLKWCHMDRSCPVCRKPVKMLVYGVVSDTKYSLLNVAKLPLPKRTTRIPPYFMHDLYRGMEVVQAIAQITVFHIHSFHIGDRVKNQPWQSDGEMLVVAQLLRTQVMTLDFALQRALTEFVESFDETACFPPPRMLSKFSKTIFGIKDAVEELSPILRQLDLVPFLEPNNDDNV